MGLTSNAHHINIQYIEDFRATILLTRHEHVRLYAIAKPKTILSVKQLNIKNIDAKQISVR